MARSPDSRKVQRSVTILNSCISDPSLAVFSKVQERDDRDHLLIEGEFAVIRALQSEVAIHRIVATPKVAARLHAQFQQTQIYAVSAAELKALAGYNFHRGCMASAARPRLSPGTPLHRGVIAMGLTDPLNLGALIRNIKAFGAAGLWIGPGCADPFSRRCTRASMGHNFSVPLFTLQDPMASLDALDLAGIRSIAAALGERASPLPTFVTPERWTLWVGNEGHGLDPQLRDRCSHWVQIPMSPGSDSVNVATATGIFLYHLSRP